MPYKGYRDSSWRLHRLDGPAIIFSDGSKKWFRHGELHRLDGPAIEESEGSKFWFLRSKEHREDGPAVEYSDGTKLYYHHGKLHRLDGPAIIDSNGTESYYLQGKNLSKELFYKLTSGPVENLPLHLGKGFDAYISKRLTDAE